MIEADLSNGSLAVLDVDDMPPHGYTVTMSAVHLLPRPLGAAGKWSVDRSSGIAARVDIFDAGSALN